LQWKEGMYDAARRGYEGAVSRLETFLPATDIQRQISIALANWGALELEKTIGSNPAELELAGKLLERSRKLRQEIVDLGASTDKDRIELARTISNLAKWHLKRGEADAALDLSKKTKGMWDEAYHKRPTDVEN